MALGLGEEGDRPDLRGWDERSTLPEESWLEGVRGASVNSECSTFHPGHDLSHNSFWFLKKIDHILK